MAKRIDWKKLDRVPQFKKKVARFLSAIDIANGVSPSLHDILTLGHRGYIQYSEKELSKLFDKAYDKLLKDIQELEKLNQENTHDSWRRNNLLGSLRAQVSEADEIVATIFEREVLT